LYFAHFSTQWDFWRGIRQLPDRLEPRWAIHAGQKEHQKAEQCKLADKNAQKVGAIYHFLNHNGVQEEFSVKPCSTPGSCDFEESLCGFANSQIFSSNSQFQRKQSLHFGCLAFICSKSVGDSFVAEATINPGEIAVLESATNMTDGDYTILFNHFESATANSMQKPTFSA
jgi:hypothetical protein